MLQTTSRAVRIDWDKYLKVITLLLNYQSDNITNGLGNTHIPIFCLLILIFFYQIFIQDAFWWIFLYLKKEVYTWLMIFTCFTKVTLFMTWMLKIVISLKLHFTMIPSQKTFKFFVWLQSKVFFLSDFRIPQRYKANYFIACQTILLPCFSMSPWKTKMNSLRWSFSWIKKLI